MFFQFCGTGTDFISDQRILDENVIPSYFPMPSPSTPISVIFKENKSFFFILLTCEVGVKISFGSDFISSYLLVLRIFVSSRRLYPCHSRLLSGTFARISRMVSIFASTLSAKLKAIASTSAGSSEIHTPVLRGAPECSALTHFPEPPEIPQWNGFPRLPTRHRS